MSDIQLSSNGSIAVVRLARASVLNALSVSMKQELTKVFAELDSDNETSGVILLGLGRAFCAGSDVKEMKEFGPAEAEAMLRIEHEMFDKILRCSKPVVVGSHGYALGAGFQLAACADVLVATRDCVFGMPELKFGAVNGNETAILLPLGGLSLARRLLLNYETCTGAELEQWGCVAGLVGNDDQLEAAATRAAERLCEVPRDAYSRQKELILNWLDMHYRAAVLSSIGAAALGWNDPANIGSMRNAL